MTTPISRSRVQSGITLAALRETLARQQQFLPFDAPRPAQTTIGGTVALNINGPRRGYYGGVRDLVIGMKVALMTGEQIKAGGKVVKNVAGYDMCKLFTGSLGTLGVITEVTVRVAPIAETAATIIASGIFDEVVEFVDQLSQSPLLPAAVVLMNSHRQYGSGNPWQAAVWCDGLQETSRGTCRTLKSWRGNLDLARHPARRRSRRILGWSPGFSPCKLNAASIAPRCRGRRWAVSLKRCARRPIQFQLLSATWS